MTSFDEHVGAEIELVISNAAGNIEKVLNMIEKQVNELPTMSKAIVLAIAVEHLSYKEVALRYNISLNTVKTHYSRALKRLRKELSADVLNILLIIIYTSYSIGS